ncbi:unnamed protein product [Phytophthora fragariaefolia]|uniref:Unnamed protein product n=1 Tax=Phytophthora fragariaefolia TaxID=1490495 RepID=A0A9W6YLV0_9STRA|nr:unnamed protein product [Phytophthora fragariaefolia]
MATTNLQNKYTNTEEADPRLQLGTNANNNAELKVSSRTGSTVDKDDVELTDSVFDTTADRSEFFLLRSRYSDEVIGMSALGFGSHNGMNMQSQQTQIYDVAGDSLVGEAIAPTTSDELEVATTLFKLLNQVEKCAAQEHGAQAQHDCATLSASDKISVAAHEYEAHESADSKAMTLVQQIGARNPEIMTTHGDKNISSESSQDEHDNIHCAEAKTTTTHYYPNEAKEVDNRKNLTEQATKVDDNITQVVSAVEVAEAVVEAAVDDRRGGGHR